MHAVLIHYHIVIVRSRMWPVYRLSSSGHPFQSHGELNAIQLRHWCVDTSASQSLTRVSCQNLLMNSINGSIIEF